MEKTIGITEDYIGYETAKLLKEKGFAETSNTIGTYNDKGEFYLYKHEKGYNHNHLTSWYSAPTLQMTMKWLREVHNLHIEVYRTACGYLYIISRVPTGSDLYSDGEDYDGDDEDSGQWTTNEKACEAAIKYCLENLI